MYSRTNDEVRIQMSKKFTAIGNMVALKTNLQTEEKTTTEGIIYKDSQLDETLVVWSEVYSVGPYVRVDIKEGDWVCWKLNSASGHFKTGDLVLDLVPGNELLAVRDAT